MENSKTLQSSRILLICGGINGEREVSLMSGDACYQALCESGYQCEYYDYTGDLPDLLKKLGSRPDLVFNALHGSFGEDGTLSGILDEMKIAYTHSGLQASAIGMDKALTKKIAKGLGIQTPSHTLIPAGCDYRRVMTGTLSYPSIIKDRYGGSTVGVYFIDNAAKLTDVPYCVSCDRLWEAYIPGREFTVSVLNGRGLAVTEIPSVSDLGIYDYDTKYKTGRTAHTCPADITKEAADLMIKYSEDLHNDLNCLGVTRSDFRWDDRFPIREGLFLLELNTHPGLTPQSLVPEQAEHSGMSFSFFISHLIEDAKGSLDDSKN